MVDPRRAEARHLRATTRMSLFQLREHFGVSRNTLADWLWNEPVPDWTRRPTAKDELREQAVQLRIEGCTVPQIATELKVAKSTAYQWVKHLPLDATVERGAERRRQHAQHMTDVRWGPHRQTRDAEPNKCRLAFINSDPVLILLFVRFLELLGVDRSQLTYRISIHESAEVEVAGRWWADAVGAPFDAFRRPTLKKHNPSTVRRNVGEPYRGCPIIAVPQSRTLYWRVEGIMRGIAVATASQRDGRMSPADML